MKHDSNDETPLYSGREPKPSKKRVFVGVLLWLLFVILSLVLWFVVDTALSARSTGAVNLPTCQYSYLPSIHRGWMDGDPTATIPPAPTYDPTYDANNILSVTSTPTPNSDRLYGEPTATIPPPPLQCNTPTPVSTP